MVRMWPVGHLVAFYDMQASDTLRQTRIVQDLLQTSD